MTETSGCSRITPAPSGGVYQGAFLGDSVTINANNIDSFEQMSGTPLDIVLKFMAFSTGLNFPTSQAEAVANQGGALFIKLEPWSYGGANDPSFSLQNIIDGKHDDLLRRFAQGAKNFGKPVLVSFGHEMNGNWYPWAGNAELYKQAFQHVHEVISETACNITWVWNPNIDFPASNYYPGSDYVDWIALDGYNWDGANTASNMFTAWFEPLKNLGKPLMVGEFGCGQNNTACLTDFVDYVSDPSNNISAYVYFNMNKTEEGAHNLWEIETNAEQTAYHDAILRHQAFFSGSVQSQEVTAPAATPIPPITSAPPAPAVQLKMPPGFDENDITPTEEESALTPAQLFSSNTTKISASNSREANNNTHINTPTGFIDDLVSQPVYVSANFAENIIQWMLLRENGTPTNQPLLDSLRFKAKASPYWKTKAAFLIVTGEADPDQIDFLKAFGYVSNNYHPTFPLSKAERFNILKKIYESYPNNVQFEGTDLLLKAEMQVQLALLAPDEETAAPYLGLAGTSLERILANHNDEVRKIIRQRLLYLKTLDVPVEQQVAKEFTFYQGQARALKAQLLLFQTKDIMDPADALKKLEEAYGLLKESVPFLYQENPIHFLQVKRLAAECLVRMAFIMKDFKSSLNLQGDPILTEIQNWERAVFGNVSPEAYQSLFAAAEVMVQGVPNKSVLDWEAAYNQLEQIRESLIWLKQISTYARAWLANLRMVEIGEDRGVDESPKIYLPRQKASLEEAESLLREIIDSGALSDVEELAFIKRSLAENLARQGFILMDFGDDSYTTLLNDAKTLLDGVVAQGRPEAKAEASLWLAKILLVRAGKTALRSEKEALLSEAQEKIAAALAKEDGEYLLMWGTLSSAFQTYGEILLAMEDFVEAEKKFRQALGENLGDQVLRALFDNYSSIRQVFTENYSARASLGDVLNWRSRFDEAKAEYDKLLAEAPANHPTRRHAELALLEVAARKIESYENLLQNQALFEKIFMGEAPASPLISRAIDDLIEAWGTSENYYENIILTGNILLGTGFPTELGVAGLLQVLKDSQIILSQISKAKLYLRVGETLTSEKRFADAKNILPEQDQAGIIPSALLNVIQNDPELKLLYHLLRAERKMKEDRRVHWLTGYKINDSYLIGEVLNSRYPDLIQKVIFDQLDGYSFEDDFPMMIETARHYLTPASLNQIESKYVERGRETSFLKFKFRLWKKLADALAWDKQYPQALEELDKLYAEIEDQPSLPPEFVSLIKAQVYVNRGDIYRYVWDGQDFEQSERNFLDAVSLVNNLPSRSKETNVTWTWALLGLGEVYRYGKELRNYAKATEAYTAAEAVAMLLPVKSDEHPLLLTRIYLGMAKLEEMYGNLNLAYDYIQSCVEYLDKTYKPHADLVSEINTAYNEIATRAGLVATAGTNIFHGADGHTEYQILTGVEIPFRFGPDHLLRLLIQGQMDFGPDSTLFTPYFGLAYTNFFHHGSFSVGLDTRFPLLNDWVGNFGSGNGTRFFFRHDLTLEALLWTDYITIGGRVSINDLIDIADTDLDSWSASALGNLAAAEIKWLKGLRFGVEYNSYPYYWEGEYHRLHTLGVGFRYQYEIKDWWALQVSFMKTFNLGEGANEGFLPFEFGIGTEFSIGRYLNILLNYNRQQTVEYPLDYFNFTIQFVH